MCAHTYINPKDEEMGRPYYGSRTRDDSLSHQLLFKVAIIQCPCFKKKKVYFLKKGNASLALSKQKTK